MSNRLAATMPIPRTSLKDLADLLQDAGQSRRGAAALGARQAICEKELRPEHPYTATEPGQLRPAASTRRATRRGAAALGARVSNPRECLRPDHPDTATSLNDLAPLLQAQGNLIGTRPLLERALASVRKRSAPSIHIDEPRQPRPVASAQGEFVGARPLFERALAIQRESTWSRASKLQPMTCAPICPASASHVRPADRSARPRRGCSHCLRQAAWP